MPIQVPKASYRVGQNDRLGGSDQVNKDLEERKEFKEDWLEQAESVC